MKAKSYFDGRTRTGTEVKAPTASETSSLRSLLLKRETVAHLGGRECAGIPSNGIYSGSRAAGNPLGEVPLEAAARRQSPRELPHDAVRARSGEHHPDINGSYYVASVDEVELVTKAPARRWNHDWGIARGEREGQRIFFHAEEDGGVTRIPIRELRRANRSDRPPHPH